MRVSDLLLNVPSIIATTISYYQSNVDLFLSAGEFKVVEGKLLIIEVGAGTDTQ